MSEWKSAVIHIPHFSASQAQEIQIWGGIVAVVWTTGTEEVGPLSLVSLELALAKLGISVEAWF
ncbi:MAG TPA: hypothetical protein VKR52_18365 [Terracidiphilus sp.]|nr:hypothetical protein [Terracidiphilus sp.]